MVDDDDIEPGDIFCCWGADWPSRLISLETSLTSWISLHSGLRLSPSHVAIASPYSDDESCAWFESTTMVQESCLLYGQPVSGMQCHYPMQRVMHYLMRGGYVVQYRLVGIDRLQLEEIARLKSMLVGWCGNLSKSPRLWG